MKIETTSGSITEQSGIDAIVNAANTELWMGSGVAGAVKRDGGDEVEVEAVAKGPINLGEAVFTHGGKLPNKYVIHAAAMGYRKQDDRVPKTYNSMSSDEIIRNCTINSLRLAGQLGVRSIAFPALATGVGRFPTTVCAQLMVGAIRDFAKTHPDTQIERVVFVLFKAEDQEIFDREIRKSSLYL